MQSDNNRGVKTIVRAVVLAVIGGLAATLVAAAPTPAWQVPEADYRVVVTKPRDSPKTANVGQAQVWAVGIAPTNCAVAVFAQDGKQVGARVCWAVPGEPLRILFDCSSGQPEYVVYVSRQALATSPNWQPAAGVLLETRERPDGPDDSWNQFKVLWQKSPTVQGRSVVPNIYSAINPHGPDTRFLAYYKGVFQALTKGQYGFATRSTGPSFMLVDGSLVTQWLGQHMAKAGSHAQHHGYVTLASGRHVIEYYEAQGDGDFEATVGWRPAGAKDFTIMPSEAFGSVAAFRTVTAEAAPRRPEQSYFEVNTVAHSRVDNLTLVTSCFRVLADKATRTYNWTFDDGTSATGPQVWHVFLRPGLRQVQLVVSEQGRPLASYTQPVAVQPRWELPAEWTDNVFDSQRRVILERDLSTMPIADLIYAIRFAEKITDHKLLTHLGAECLRRQHDFPADAAEVFLWLALHYQQPEVQAYEQAEQAFHAALELNSGDADLRQRTQLRLARFYLDNVGKPDEAAKLLDSLDPALLSHDDQRQRLLAQGDVLLARGDVAGARAKYLGAGDLVNRLDERYVVTRRARLQSALDFLRRQEYTAAEELLQQVVWESPAERLQFETGFAYVQICLGRQEYRRALTLAERLGPVATGESDHAMLLYYLTDIQRHLGQNSAADEALAQLLAQHPYSEAAARAKERWGVGAAQHPGN